MPPPEQGTLHGRVKPETGLTGFTRIGWVLPWCVLVLVSITWISLLSIVRKKEYSEAPS